MVSATPLAAVEIGELFLGTRYTPEHRQELPDDPSALESRIDVAETEGGDQQRVLRWGGTLLVTTPNQPRLVVALEALRGAPLERRLDPRTDHLRFFTARTLAASLVSAGFATCEVRAVGGRPLARRSLHALAS